MTTSEISTGSLRGRAAAFPWPRDGQAWWSFLACQVGGWAFILGPRLDLQALGLALAAFSLFFASDWMSHLAGRSREGAVKPVEWPEPVGLGLLAVTAASLTVFMLRTQSPEREAWSMVVTGIACLVALMFILRLEMRALDGRLLYLSHLILTLPALTIGFVRYGVGSPQAFAAWVLPGVYYPAQALFAHYWMEGTDAPGSSLSVLAVPLLLGILAEACCSGWMGAVFLGLFLLRAIWLLQRRRLSGKSLPGFAEVRRLSLEFQGWNLAGLLAWGLAMGWG